MVRRAEICVARSVRSCRASTLLGGSWGWGADWVVTLFRLFFLLMNEAVGSYRKIVIDSSPIARHGPHIGLGRTVAEEVAPFPEPGP